MISDKRLWLTADESRLVPDGHKDAAFLFCIPGRALMGAEEKLYADYHKVKEAPPVEIKEAPPQADKQVWPAENKRGGKPPVKGKGKGKK